MIDIEHLGIQHVFIRQAVEFIECSISDVI